MKQLLTVLILGLSLHCFSQPSKKDTLYHDYYIVYFPDSSSYVEFKKEMGGLPSEPYAPLYEFFKRLPAQYQRLYQIESKPPKTIVH
jgi:hypothetical protein